MTSPLFFAADLDRLAGAGDTVSLTGAEAHHAIRVMRLAQGQPLSIADGDGFVAHGRVAEIAGARLDMIVDGVEAEPPPATHLVLVQALAKGDRDLQAIEAATEVGVDTVIPWSADRSVVVWRGDRADKALRKWEATLVAASKQSRRARRPRLGGPVTTTQLAASIGADPPGMPIVLHEDAEDSLAELVRTAGGSAGEATGSAGTRTIMLIVGPEGGISDAELDLLRAAGATPARIGPHVLRSSTAGPVALSVIRTALGDWDAR